MVEGDEEKFLWLERGREGEREQESTISGQSCYCGSLTRLLMDSFCSLVDSILYLMD